jgi:hypothetical protein
MIALRKKPAATNCNNLTVSLNAHTAKVVLVILRRRIENKIEDLPLIGEDQFEVRIGKGTRDAIGMLRIISE